MFPKLSLGKGWNGSWEHVREVLTWSLHKGSQGNSGGLKTQSTQESWDVQGDSCCPTCSGKEGEGEGECYQMDMKELHSHFQAVRAKNKEVYLGLGFI